jgi:hypothetical protein
VTKSLESLSPLRPKNYDVNEVVDDIENHPGNEATKDQTAEIHLPHTTSDWNRKSIYARESTRYITLMWILSKLRSSLEAAAKAGQTGPPSIAAVLKSRGGERSGIVNREDYR